MIDMGASRLRERNDAVSLDFPEEAKPVRIVGLSLDVYEDVLYILDVAEDGTGRVWVADAAHSGTPERRDIWDQAAWGQPRHMIRDGGMPGLLYIAAEKALLKSVDGLTTIQVMRTLSGGREGMMIGYGAERAADLRVALTIQSDATLEQTFVVDGGHPEPAGWEARTFDDSAWGPSRVGDDPASFYAGIPGVNWSGVADEHQHEYLWRRTFAVPFGVVPSAVLRINVDDALGGLFLNGTDITALFTGHTGASPIPASTIVLDPALFRPGLDNVLAGHVINGGGTTSYTYKLVIS